MSHSIVNKIFECFTRSHACLYVSHSTHTEYRTCVDVAFYFQVCFWVGGTWIGVWIFIICFGGWGKCSFETEFGWGMGVVLLGILRGLFFIKGIVLLIFFLCFVVEH